MLDGTGAERRADLIEDIVNEAARHGIAPDTAQALAESLVAKLDKRNMHAVLKMLQARIDEQPTDTMH